MKAIQPSQSGHSHLIFPLAVPIVISLVGLRLLSVSHADVTSVPAIPKASYGPKGFPSAPGLSQHAVGHASDGNAVHYLYVTGIQNARATGASVQIYQAQPKVGPQDYHSLAELAVYSTDSLGNFKNMVEFGWTVDRLMYHDSLPRLFVYYRVNGEAACYNSCGFVQVSRLKAIGDSVKVGKTGIYEIAYSHSQQRWWIKYNGVKIGYYPGHLWRGNFTHITEVQAFGEVSTASATPCTQMGDGLLGSLRGSAFISHFALIGTKTKPALNYSVTDPLLYNTGVPSNNYFHFGDPGIALPLPSNILF